MNESIQQAPRDVTSLSRKSWTAYVWPVVQPWKKGVAGVKWRDLDETINSRHQELIRSGQLM